MKVRLEDPSMHQQLDAELLVDANERFVYVWPQHAPLPTHRFSALKTLPHQAAICSDAFYS